MNEDKSWKIKITRISSIILTVIYIFGILIPNYYISTAELPEKKDLNVSKGTIVLKRSFNQVHSIGIKEYDSDKKKFFSCTRAYSGRRIICAKNFATSKEVEKFAGKQAEIYWYEQKIFSSLFIRRRMVIINIEGNEMLSYEKVRDDIASSAFWAPFYAGILLLVFSMTILISEALVRNINNKK